MASKRCLYDFSARGVEEGKIMWRDKLTITNFAMRVDYAVGFVWR
jgi:hypothetical protein